MTVARKLKVLCLDGEGGYGGSSRSLAKALQYIDRDAVDLEVWCRRSGPIQEVYSQLGIPCTIYPDIPSAGAVARFSRNIISQLRSRYAFAKSRGFRQTFIERARQVDIVHYNLESQWLIASWARARLSAVQTMHVRTNPIVNLFSEWQSRKAISVIDRFVFITQNEKAHFESLAGQTAPGTVIFNIVDEPAISIPHPDIPLDGRLRIGVLSNYDWSRGLDRLIDIAAELARRGRKDFLFVVAGNMRLHGPMYPALKKAAATGGSLADYARSEGVDNMFFFLGHVTNPESVLAACDVLAKPTRLDNPWGRDIIEALAAKTPVLSQGFDQTFVETDVTGMLFEKFDAGEWADSLVALSEHRTRIASMGIRGAQRVAALCDGPSRAADLLAFWRGAASHRQLENRA